MWRFSYCFKLYRVVFVYSFFFFTQFCRAIENLKKKILRFFNLENVQRGLISKLKWKAKNLQRTFFIYIKIYKGWGNRFLSKHLNYLIYDIINTPTWKYFLLSLLFFIIAHNVCFDYFLAVVLNIINSTRC